jgi:hypothetical protein
MNDFRLALEAHLAGRMDVQTLETTLRASLQKQPHLAAAHSAIIEAMFRSQRLSAQARDSLHQVVQSAGQAAPSPQPPAPPPAAASDKTQFRMPAAPSPPPARPGAASRAPPTRGGGAAPSTRSRRSGRSRGTSRISCSHLR